MIVWLFKETPSYCNMQIKVPQYKLESHLKKNLFRHEIARNNNTCIIPSQTKLYSWPC